MALRTGTIAITGAGGHVGRTLQAHLAGLPNDIRPLGRTDDLFAALRDAEVVVHLAGTLAPAKGDTYESANLETARAVAAAVAGSEVQRIIDTSYVDADPDAENAYLRAKGMGERALAETGVPLLVVRCPWIFGPAEDPGPSFAPFLAHGGRAVTVIGRGDQRIAPVYVEDVAEALTRSAVEPAAPTGTYALAGPEELTLDEMVELLNGAGVRERHVPPSVSRLLAHLVPELNPTLVDVLLRDSLPHDPPLAPEVGMALRGPTDVFAPGAS
jgi:NADH dehydrogenase